MIYRVNFVCRIGTEPEITNTGLTNAITCRAVINENYAFTKDEDSRWVTLYLDALRFKKLLKYIKKGRLAFVNGGEYVRGYMSDSGEIKVDTKVVVDSFEFIPTRKRKKSENNDIEEYETFHSTEEDEVPPILTDIIPFDENFYNTHSDIDLPC